MQETILTRKASGKRWHTLVVLLLFQIPLLLLLLHLGPVPLWWRAQYNLLAITAWCWLCRSFWKDSANCLACSLFCTFAVWFLAMLPEIAATILQTLGLIRVHP